MRQEEKMRLDRLFFRGRLFDAVKKGKFERVMKWSPENTVYWTGPDRIKIVVFTGHSKEAEEGEWSYEHAVLELDRVPDHIILEELYKQNEYTYSPLAYDFYRLLKRKGHI